MFTSQSTLLALVALFSVSVPMVNAHAKITSPAIRVPGQSFLQTCGTPSFNSVTGDPTGHIEEQEPFNAGCEPTLCRGMLFADQPASNVQAVVPGQPMAMGVDCTIPHGGPANVSLVDTTVGGAGAIIGSFLATFDDFCPTSGVTPADQSNLQFNLPSADVIGNKCQTAGDCVVQLFWATPDFSQNYYYCVDVQVNAAVAAPSTSITTSVPATTTTVATSTTSTSTTVSTDSASLTTSSSTTSITSTSTSTDSSSTAAVTTPPVDPATSALPASDAQPQSTSTFFVVVQPSGMTRVTTSAATSTATLAGALGSTGAAGRSIDARGAGMAMFSVLAGVLIVGRVL